MSTYDFSRYFLAVVASAAAFIVVGELQLLIPAEISSGVSAPYLPAGVRLIAAVVCGLFGSIGVFLASLVMAPETFPNANLLELLTLASISAFVPLLALVAVRRVFGIGEQLQELSFRSLLLLIVLQSVLSPIAHQTLYYFTALTPASPFHLLVMISGDLVGCMLVVLGVAAFWGLMNRR